MANSQDKLGPVFDNFKGQKTRPLAKIGELEAYAATIALEDVLSSYAAKKRVFGTKELTAAAYTAKAKLFNISVNGGQ